MTKLSRIIDSLLPGLFLVGFTVGTGSVTAMVKAGADHGTSLLWALLLSCLVSYILFDSFGRLTIHSGCSALFAIRKKIHPALAMFLLISLSLNVSASVMGVMGILASILTEWSTSWGVGMMSALVWASIVSVIIFLVLITGSVKSIEKILAALAGVMGICFIANAVTMLPSPEEVIQGLVPNIPEVSATNSSRSGFLVVASMVGTTVAPIVLILRSILVREQEWTTEQLATQKRDAAVSATLVFVISAAIMISAAGSLHRHGVEFQHVREMVPLLQPIAGSLAVTIFVLGVSAAGISSQFPNVASVPWMRHDYRGDSAQIRSNTDRMIVLGMCALGLVVPIFHTKPVWVMLASQAVGSIILPTTVLCLAYLLNNKQLMGEHVNRPYENLLLALVAVFSLAMAGVGIIGFIS